MLLPHNSHTKFRNLSEIKTLINPDTFVPSLKTEIEQILSESGNGSEIPRESLNRLWLFTKVLSVSSQDPDFESSNMSLSQIDQLLSEYNDDKVVEDKINQVAEKHVLTKFENGAKQKIM